MNSLSPADVVPPRVARRIDPRVARHIDRLARRAHAFHRFAHHPLCAQYSGELIAIGARTRVCRGCSSALAGTVCGAVLASGIEFPAIAALEFALLAMAVPLLALRFERDREGARLGKLWTRAVPFAALALAFTAGVHEHSVSGAAIAGSIALALFALVRVYRNIGPNRSPCARCPERSSSVPCSGFRDIVRAERAFVRRSRRLLTQANP
jgi:hypothetical protein